MKFLFWKNTFINILEVQVIAFQPWPPQPGLPSDGAALIYLRGRADGLAISCTVDEYKQLERDLAYVPWKGETPL